MDLSAAQECSQDTAAGFPQHKRPKREQGRDCHVFYDLASEGALHLFQNILLVAQPPLFSVGKNHTAGTGITGDSLEGWLPCVLNRKGMRQPLLSLSLLPLPEMTDECSFVAEGM